MKIPTPSTRKASVVRVFEPRTTPTTRKGSVVSVASVALCDKEPLHHEDHGDSFFLTGLTRFTGCCTALNLVNPVIMSRNLRALRALRALRVLCGAVFLNHEPHQTHEKAPWPLWSLWLCVTRNDQARLFALFAVENEHLGGVGF